MHDPGHAATSPGYAVMVSLDGNVVLLVQDEFLIAARVEEMLVELGAAVIGPVGKMSDG